MDLNKPHFKGPNIKRIIQKFTQACQICENKIILKQNVPQPERGYDIKGYAHLWTGKLTLYICLKP